MRKIVKVEIINFQSHKKATINFANFVVIVGHTDGGKSAVIRAIKWCLYNSPDGTEFIRHGETFAEVIVYFNDGSSIRRYRSNKENSYRLTKPDGKVIDLEGFGAGAVTDVINFHGMREVNFFGPKQSLNICDQLAPPFFLTSTPGVRAEMIGKIANTDIIDRAIKNIGSDIREKKANLKEYKSDLIDVNEKLKTYSDLTMMERDLKRVKELRDAIESTALKIRRMETLNTEVIRLVQQRDRLQVIIDKRTNLEEVSVAIENLLTLYLQSFKMKKANILFVEELKRRDDLLNMIEKISTSDIDTGLKNIEDMLCKIKLAVNIDSVNNKYRSDKLKVKVLQETVEKTGDVAGSLLKLELCQTKLTESVKLNSANEALRKEMARKQRGQEVIVKLGTEMQFNLENYKDTLKQSKKCPICMSDLSETEVDKLKDIV